MENTLLVKVRRFGPTMIEAKGSLVNKRTRENVRVVLCLETGETISSNVPIGGGIWRQLARIARGHI